VDIDAVYDAIVDKMTCTLAQLKTLVEQEKMAEEQERLRKIQVSCILTDHIFRINVHSFLYFFLSFVYIYTFTNTTL